MYNPNESQLMAVFAQSSYQVQSIMVLPIVHSKILPIILGTMIILRRWVINGFTFSLSGASRFTLRNFFDQRCGLWLLPSTFVWTTPMPHLASHFFNITINHHIPTHTIPLLYSIKYYPCRIKLTIKMCIFFLAKNRLNLLVNVNPILLSGYGFLWKVDTLAEGSEKEWNLESNAQ